MLLKSLFIIVPITIILTGALPLGTQGPVSDNIAFAADSEINFSRLGKEVVIRTVQAAAGVLSKAQGHVQNFRAPNVDRTYASAAVSDSSVQQSFSPAFNQNVDQQAASTRPYSYDEIQASTGSQDSNVDNVNHQSMDRSYQVSTQRSPNSPSQQDNDRLQGRPVSNNGNGNSFSNNNNNIVNQFPESIPTAESGADQSNRESNKQASTTVRPMTQYPISTQRYQPETSTPRTQSWQNPTPTVQPTRPRRPTGGAVLHAPQRPVYQELDPNPILSPVDRVPVMIEYPKIDYDQVELTTRVPLNKNPNKQKHRHNNGNDQSRSPDS